jgi:6-phosphogluconolactonase
MTGPRILVVADPEAAAAAAADRISVILGAAAASRGVAHFATTGGSTPIGIYRRLAAAPLRDAMPWSELHVWWGDDRFVRRGDPLSNVTAFDDVLLREGGVPLDDDRIHPFPVDEAVDAGEGPDWCAARLADELRAADLEQADGWPVLDLALLGVGGDGHILSVFPGSSAFDATEWALGIPAPTHIEPHVPRVTLNPATVTVARHVLAVAAGSSKADVVAEILTGPRDVRRLPAQLAVRPGATWILDEAAAAKLPG